MRLGVLPELVLANRKFPLPSSDVMGRVPLDARAKEEDKEQH